MIFKLSFSSVMLITMAVSHLSNPLLHISKKGNKLFESTIVNYFVNGKGYFNTIQTQNSMNCINFSNTTIIDGSVEQSPNSTIQIDNNVLNLSNFTANLESNSNSNSSTNEINEPNSLLINSLLSKYKSKISYCISPLDPSVDIILCGTMHIAKSSVDMVSDVIKSFQPQYIMLEICESRMDGLVNDVSDDDNITPITLQSIFRQSISDKSIINLGVGLLSWMQYKAAKLLGNKLGGELTVAIKEGAKLNSLIILGDRLASVTTQRLFDKLNIFDKILMILIILQETLTMSLSKISDYITKSENDENFINKEMEKFKKYLPKVSSIIISERDEYLTQSINEIIKFNIKYKKRIESLNIKFPKTKVVVIVGAGHLPGIIELIKKGNIDINRLNEISISSKHLVSTWPGEGCLQYINHHKQRAHE